MDPPAQAELSSAAGCPRRQCIAPRRTGLLKRAIWSWPEVSCHANYSVQKRSGIWAFAYTAEYLVLIYC